ncbi:MAG: hypothetical protein ABJR05_07625 [Balneola sp.]
MKESEFIIDHASKFSKEEIASFKKVVLDAGEVSSYTFDGLIEKNPILLFYPNTKDIKAVGALKIPNLGYKQRVFKESESKAKHSDFKYELGWIVCLDKGKGIGQKVTEKLSNHLPIMYATVRKDNLSMNHIIQKFGFKKSGNSYDSSRGDYQNNLFVKEE